MIMIVCIRVPLHSRMHLASGYWLVILQAFVDWVTPVLRSKLHF
jgi:hypothetical protein